MRLRQALCSVLLLLAACGGSAVAMADGEPGVQPLAFAVGAHDAPMAVRPLDDPANPYLGQYSAVDRWIYAHAWTHAELVAFRTAAQQRSKDHPELLRQSGPRELPFIGAFVDPRGWMRPVGTENIELETHDADWPLYDRALEPVPQQDVQQRIARQIFAGPSYPAGLAEEYDQQLNKFAASQTPRLPDWLGQQPPRRTICLPDGTFLTYGPPRKLPEVVFEHGVGMRPGWNDPGLPWQHYSATGALLAEYATSSAQTDYCGWVDSFWPKRQATLAGPDGRLRSVGDAGGLFWIQFEAPPTLSAENAAYAKTLPEPVQTLLLHPADARLPLAAFRYDGTPLDIMQPLPLDLRGHRDLDQGSLAETYQAQQYFGVWLGQAEAQTTRVTASTPQGN